MGLGVEKGGLPLRRAWGAPAVIPRTTTRRRSRGDREVDTIQRLGNTLGTQLRHYRTEWMHKTDLNEFWPEQL